MSFEEASGPAPSFGIHGGKTVNDAASLLPEAAANRLIAFAQRVSDLHAAQPPFESIHELAQTKIRHANQIAQLELPRGEGGFEMPPDAPQVMTERRALERVEKELSRLRELKEVRAARWTPAKQLEAKVIDWVCAGGIPVGCALEDVENAPEVELLKKGERISDAVDRYRHRLRELNADAHRVRSAPYPSADAKSKLRQQIEALAEAGRPNCDAAVEYGQPVSFGVTTLRSQVFNASAGAVAFSEETPDVMAFVCFLLGADAVCKRIAAEIDAISDDKAALSQTQREQQEAAIMVDHLTVERMEVALIRIAEAKGEMIDYRADTSPQALLGVRLVNASPQQPDSNGHAFTISYGSR